MEIRVFISKHCFSSEDVIQYFQEKNLDVNIIDVTNDQNRIDEMVKLGGIATPFIIIDNEVIPSFDKSKVDRILEG